MLAGNPELRARIEAEIRAQGAMSFARFMELALYEPQHGYYASGRASIGRAGDFFTNVSVGALFGRLIAAQFVEIWEKSGRPSHFQIVEQGAHDGTFALDALRAVGGSRPELCDGLTYMIVEPFTRLRLMQQDKLRGWEGTVRWVDSIEKLEPFTGVHFSNELFDALPTHLLESMGEDLASQTWDERLVTVVDGEFDFVVGPASNPELLSRLECLPPRPAGYRTEVNLAASRLIREIAGKIEMGVVLTLDYGYTRAEFYSPKRREGTLQVRAEHRILSSPFAKMGCADLSSHVEWTSLAQATTGLARPIGFGDQHHFFAGVLSSLIGENEIVKLSEGERRRLQTLLHPEMLGRTFQVLALGRNFPHALSGFRFTKPPAEALGLASSSEAV